jgi:hypothetical protein
VLILLPPSEKKATTAGPAIELYTGVLFTALGWASLPKAAQNRGADSIVIISAKYGAITPLTHIKPYKEKINNESMRAPIATILDPRKDDFIIDCRSSTYQSVWRSPMENTVEIKIFTKVDGVKKVITHMSKKTRGEVTRAILLTKAAPKKPHQLFEIIQASFECELIARTPDTPWVLEVYC